jgi:alkylhydroperoxidase/carboxymuconolactone decarboxylase family protein YurZ
MDPITPHLSRAERKTRRTSLDQQIAASPMRVPPAMRSVSRQVFGDGAISKKHKELTALAVAVATNCWE